MSSVTPPNAALSAELLELARRQTRGDASPRRHQASRARVLDRVTARSSKPVGLAFAFAALAIGGGAALFAGVKELDGHAIAIGPTPSVVPTGIHTSAPAVKTAMFKDTPPAGDAVQLQVSPEHATLFWDDKKLDGNPASFPFVPDGRMHRVRAEAPGYATKTQLVSMNGPNVLISLQLQPLSITLGPVSSSASVINADQLVESMRRPFRECYTEALVATPALAGKVTVVLQLNDRGKVESSELAEQDGLNGAVTSCLVAKAGSVVFRVGDKGWVKIPLAFTNQ